MWYIVSKNEANRSVPYHAWGTAVLHLNSWLVECKKYNFCFGLFILNYKHSSIIISLYIWCAIAEHIVCITWTYVLVMTHHHLYAVVCTIISLRPSCDIYVDGFCSAPLLQNEYVPWLARMNNNTSHIFLKEVGETLPKNSFVAAPFVKVTIYF